MLCCRTFSTGSELDSTEYSTETDVVPFSLLGQKLSVKGAQLQSSSAYVRRHLPSKSQRRRVKGSKQPGKQAKQGKQGKQASSTKNQADAHTSVKMHEADGVRAESARRECK